MVNGKTSEQDFSLLQSRGIDVQYGALLSRFTTFRLGGRCPSVLTCAKPSDLIETVRFLSQKEISFILMGGASNLVISDEGLEDVVVRYISPQIDIREEKGYLWVSGATLLDTLALECANKGWLGINMASGIPGTVGGAVVGNAGAFGHQVGDTLIKAELIDRSGNVYEKSRGELGFRYRDSALKESGEIVLACTFKLEKGFSGELLKERNKILALRASKHPDLSQEPCAGSVFKNIEPTSSALRRQAAGWFLEEAGAKNMRVGGAYVYPKHANIIIKGEGCTSQDVYDLACRMEKAVYEKSGLTLVREVRFLGNFM